MHRILRGKRRKLTFQCCVCGEKTARAQVCCGHPMIELRMNEDLLDWAPRTSLKKS